VSRFVTNIFAPRIARRLDSLCTFLSFYRESRSETVFRAALRSFWRQALNLFAAGRWSIPLFGSPKFPSSLIWTRSSKSEPVSKPFSLAAAEGKCRKRTALLDGFGNSKDNFGFCGRFVAFCIARECGFWRSAHSNMLRFCHAGDGKRRDGNSSPVTPESRALRAGRQRGAVRCPSPERQGG